MKIKNLFFMSLAALTFAACSNDDAPVPEGTVNFSLASVATVTKASSPSIGAEGTLSSVSIYIYDEAGTTLVKTVPVTSTTTSASVSSNLPIATYKVAAVANVTPSVTSTLDALKGNVIKLSGSKTSFALFGEVDNLVVTENGGSCSIALTRLVAGVQMGDVTFDLDANVEAKYHWAVDNNNVELVGMSLKKSFENAVLGTSVHSGEAVTSEGELLSAEYGTVISENIISAPNYSTANRVYGYEATKLDIQLAVKYTFEDQTSETRYYNIENETQFTANTLYTLIAKITREGSSTGGDKDYGVTFSLRAIDWSTGAVIDGGSIGN